MPRVSRCKGRAASRQSYGARYAARSAERHLTVARPMLAALSQNVDRSKSCRRIETKVSTFAVAAAIVMLLERVSSLDRIAPVSGDGNALELRAAAAFSVTQILGY